MIEWDLLNELDEPKCIMDLRRDFRGEHLVYKKHLDILGEKGYVSSNKQGRDISLRNEFLEWLSPKNRTMALNLEKTFQVKRRKYESIIKNPEYRRRFGIYAY